MYILCATHIKTWRIYTQKNTQDAISKFYYTLKLKKGEKLYDLPQIQKSIDTINYAS